MTGQTKRKGALLDSGTPSPNPWDLSLSRQNGCSKMKALGRRIGLRRDATRAPIPGPEWQRGGLAKPPPKLNPTTPLDISLLPGLKSWDHYRQSPQHGIVVLPCASADHHDFPPAV